MKERITSSRVSKSKWGGATFWEVWVSSATFNDVHYGNIYDMFYEEEYATAQRVAKSAVGKIATFVGFRDVVAYID